MANVDNINRLIELLRTDESAKRFNMGDFFILKMDSTDNEPICGTAACIAGHACLLKYPNAMVSRSGNIIVSEDHLASPGRVAKDFLGLDWNQAEWLFYGRFTTVFSLSNITIDMAIKALEHIRDGKPIVKDLDWVKIDA